MEPISRSLLTFLLNSVWQVPLIALVAALAARLLRKSPAAHSHAVWVAALVSAIVLPLASIRRGPVETIEFPPPVVYTPSTHVQRTFPLIASPQPRTHTVSLAPTPSSILLWTYGLFVLLRLAGLAMACAATARLRRAAQPAAISPRLDEVRRRCQQALGIDRLELLFSAQLSGPATAGRSIILPESLLREQSEDVLTTSIGHEMAHMARNDFACNLAYEWLHLPISFHPAAWLIRRNIERTREMACDEMVTRRLMDAPTYACSIMTIAASMTTLPRRGYTLGVFDGDILEARIRRLLKRPAASLQRARLLLAGGLAMLALCAVMASTLSFTARAQGAAADMLKQGRDAYDREAYKTAAGDFEAAVRLDPDNLDAKLLLAKSLMKQYVAGGDPGSPMLDRARKQYLDVLAHDPANKLALHGMMIVSVDAKQLTEGAEWAHKAIAADPTDATAYYSVGRIDCMTAFPDYMKAREEAGMKPQDPGIIPDDQLRQAFRTARISQIEEGLRMLQTALQINPDYSDAMAHLNLLYRMEAGVADTPVESAALMKTGDAWVGKALAAKRKDAQSDRPTPFDRSDEPVMLPPPPPPPPPPRGSWDVRADAQTSEGHIYHLRGHAEIRGDDLLFRADEIDYDEDNAYIEARGNVFFHDYKRDEKVVCDKVEYWVGEQRAKVTNPRQ